MKRQILVFIILFQLIVIQNLAWDYSEHRLIGDVAFMRVYNELIAHNLFADSLDAELFIEEYLQMRYREDIENYYFVNLTHENNIITFGILNALSGDHENNPLDIDEFLRHSTSKLNRIVDLQYEYMKKYETGAPNMEVADKDFDYLLQALYDLSHFYDYGKPLEKQISEFDKDLVKNFSGPSSADDVMNALENTNSINKYISIHTFAIQLAEEAGRQFSVDPQKSKRMMYYALIFEAFANHFLEDHFASGHMVVNRSIFSALINNKALHDFYNVNGVKVANLNGDTWKQYGDGTFNSQFSVWKTKHSYYDIEYPKFTTESERVINAITSSLSEIFIAFKNVKENEEYEPLFEKFPNEEDALAPFFISEFKALSYIPIPFNTDVDNYSFPKGDIEQIKKNTQYLKDWSFIKSRVANSITLALMGDFLSGGGGWMTAEARITFGTLFYSYNYNLEQSKSGTLDRWVGTTASFGMGWLQEESGIKFRTYQAGFSYNLDWWVSDSRFLGIYGYVEAGLFSYKGIDKFMFTPSIGLQLGSLIGIPYYDWPAWTRIPIQLLLPLKFRYKRSFIGGANLEQIVIELDLVF